MSKEKCTDGRRNNKPPVSGQFKPGISPNPSGRRPGARNRKTVTLAAFNAKISITENGKRRRISKYEAGMIQLANKFALGDLKVFAPVLKLLNDYGLLEQETAAFMAQLTERDQPVLDDIVRRIRKAEPLVDDEKKRRGPELINTTQRRK